MTRVSANRPFYFLLLAATGLGWDLYTKHTVFRDLGYPGGESDWVKPFFSGWVTYRHYTSFNPGALWGLGQDYTWVFAALSIVAVVGILYWLFVHGAARSLWLTTALALIMAGTLGNLYDRLGLHGCLDETGQVLHAVRDFHLFTFGNWPWPIFNYADAFLVTGAVMLVLQSFQHEESAPSSAETRAEVEEPTPPNEASRRSASNVLPCTTSEAPGLRTAPFAPDPPSLRPPAWSSQQPSATFWKFLIDTGAVSRS